MQSVSSQARSALEHDLKCEALPLSCKVPQWRAEAGRFRIEAADRFTEAMRPKIDLAVLYRRARRLLPDLINETPPGPLPQIWPVALDELLAEPPEATPRATPRATPKATP